MRTSLREIEQIEKFIGGELPIGESLLMEACILTDHQLTDSVNLQKFLYRLLRIRHHENLKKQVDAVHKRFVSNPENKTFHSEIISLFKK